MVTTEGISRDKLQIVTPNVAAVETVIDVFLGGAHSPKISV